MKLENKRLFTSALAATYLLAVSAQAADWPVWGGDGSRNMVSFEKDIVLEFDPGRTTCSRKHGLAIRQAT